MIENERISHFELCGATGTGRKAKRVDAQRPLGVGSPERPSGKKGVEGQWLRVESRELT